MRAILAWSPRVAGKVYGAVARLGVHRLKVLDSTPIGDWPRDRNALRGGAARSQCSTRWGHVESGEPGACSCRARDWQAPDDTNDHWRPL